ncbi:SDR family oxidoreductase [Sphingomonas paeninsulae]|uniref:SDR family oxidoreductase n=1 Tax=Sphingomonas paeninsulae TaxID=2319844 RepID=A0A494TPN2_SPHPE|nr:SDR family oxidoreductase [Sphingomonas paeninsulae]AYJ87055.1 SDR family oxidoreductase [Sphingomonas paeninsulae]
MRRLAGKVAVVAGGGGIGAETAMRLAAEGCAVMLGDLSVAPAEEVVSEVIAQGGQASAMGYDQSNDDSVASLVKAAHERFGRVDFMHANAADMGAIRDDGDALTISLDTFDRTVAVNMRGYLSCTRHALPHLIENRGAIVYTSSSAAHMGEPERVAYAMTKAAVNALMRHVASRWGKEGVRANSIAPGMVLTAQIRDNLAPDFIDRVLAAHRSWRLGESADIAAMVAMLFSADGEWITGQTIAVDGGASIRP